MKFLKIRKAYTKPDKYGHRMTINEVGEYTPEGKLIKLIKILDAYEMMLSEECVIIIHEKQ
jgi:hypothetical protein